MKVLITETVTQTAVVDVPDHLSGAHLQAAVEVAKQAHDDDHGTYEQVKTLTWEWAPAPHFGLPHQLMNGRH